MDTRTGSHRISTLLALVAASFFATAWAAAEDLPPEVTDAIDELLGNLEPQNEKPMLVQSTVPLRHADAEEVSKMLNAMLGSDSKDVPTNPVIHPMKRTNSVLVATPPDGRYLLLTEIIGWLDQATEPSDLLRQELSYIPVADFLPVAAAALSKEAGEENSTPNIHWAASVGETRIVVNAQTNSILVHGSEKQRQLVGELVTKLDQRPSQIYFSAVIARVRVDDETASATDLLSEVGEAAVGGEMIKLADYRRPGFGGAVLRRPAITGGGTRVSTTEDSGLSGGFLNAYVVALEETENLQVISRPFVFTGSGQTATISSGERIPVPAETIPMLPDAKDTELKYHEQLTTMELTGTIQPDDEVSLEFEHTTDSPEFKLSGSTIVKNQDLLILPAGRGRDDKGTRYQDLIFLQPTIIRPSGDLIDKNIASVSTLITGEASPVIPRANPTKPAAAKPEGDRASFFSRELKYHPISDFLPIAAKALGRPEEDQDQSTDDAQQPASPGDGPESVLVGETLLIADPSSNKIIVSGTPERIQIVEELLNEIDVRPRSVYISAVIAQVELGDDLRYGMDILRTVDSIGLDGETVNVESLFRTTTGGGTILDPSVLGDVVDQPFFRSYTKALGVKSDGRLEFLGQPTIFAQSGKREVFESRVDPKTKLTLTVEPLVSSVDEVTLHIECLTETDVIENGVHDTSVQTLNTMVRLPDGGIVVLGGMVSEQDDKRSELLVLLQPKVISETAELSGFGRWASAMLPADARDFGDDADNDRIPNGIEYIFGERQIVSPAPGQLTAPPASLPIDVTLSLEVSTDLQHWEVLVRYEGGKLASRAHGIRIEEEIIFDEREGAADPAALYYRYRAEQ
ncbi:MAG: secretin N-terminal domain-containing protein [Verrucomicrobiales bacterium]